MSVKAGNGPRRLSATESKVLAVFRAHPNRALSPCEVGIIIGKPANKYDLEAVFRSLKRDFMIYECPEEIHTVNDVVAQSRYRLER